VHALGENGTYLCFWTENPRTWNGLWHCLLEYFDFIQKAFEGWFFQISAYPEQEAEHLWLCLQRLREMAGTSYMMR
jgi:hypothetical protein